MPDYLKNRRTKRLVVVLSEREHRIISSAAGGVNVSAWAREALLREAEHGR